MPSVSNLIASGDRVGWKQFLAECSDAELIIAWIRGQKSKIQDFGDLALDELRRRNVLVSYK